MFLTEKCVKTQFIIRKIKTVQKLSMKHSSPIEYGTLPKFSERHTDDVAEMVLRLSHANWCLYRLTVLTDSYQQSGNNVVVLHLDYV